MIVFSRHCKMMVILTTVVFLGKVESILKYPDSDLRARECVRVCVCVRRYPQKIPHHKC